MSRTVTDHGSPDRFVAGTIGLPGDRTFYLQSRKGPDVQTVVLEKEQVALLAEKLVELIDEAAHPAGAAAELEPDPADLEPLETPLTEAFRVGAFGIGWDTTEGRVVLEIHAVTDGDEEIPDIGDDTEDGPDCLRVWLSPGAARAFAARSASLVAAGRPPCPFCHLPLDPEGHICPRANGYRR
ncbi:MAG TPA: DUF3090 family protein [Actinomycetota bacterium]|nr:DUF3090 family protein [Actinomycetota bacterium]